MERTSGTDRRHGTVSGRITEKASELADGAKERLTDVSQAIQRGTWVRTRSRFQTSS